MYPDDPRPDRNKARGGGREQLLVVLIAIGVAVVVSLFGGVILYLGRMME